MSAQSRFGMLIHLDVSLLDVSLLDVLIWEYTLNIGADYQMFKEVV